MVIIRIFLHLLCIIKNRDIFMCYRAVKKIPHDS